MSEDARLALVRELEVADEAVAAVLAELDELFAASERVRERALALEEFLARLPGERETHARAVEERAHELEEAEETAARAARELGEAEAAADAERIGAARRFDVRARDAATTARRRSAEAREAAAELEDRAAATEQEVPFLESRARELAAALRDRPRLAAEAGTEPAPGLEGVSDWAAGARTALVVARTALASERDAVVRQANELGALVLGEPLTASATASVARRIERELADG